MTSSGSDLYNVRVALSALKPGWIVDHDIYAGTQKLIGAGVTISEQILAHLKNRNIQWLDVKADSQLAQAAGREPDDALMCLISKSSHLLDAHGVQQAIPEETLEKATDQVATFFHEIELGRPVDLNEVRQTVAGLLEQFLAHTNMAVKLLDLDAVDRYTYRHSINVGLLFMVIARDWCNQDELVDIVFGAVLHDLGKARVGVEIINKPGPLTDDEWVIMRRHPVWSAEMITEADASPAAIHIARSHHERLDGTGYPDGLSGDSIDRFARLAAVCDVYDALTTKRSYKSKMDYGKAMDVIIRSCGKQLDPEIAHQFLRRIGRYPAGTFVRLSSGAVAIVVRINEGAISRPVVSRVIDETGNLRRSGEEIDLSVVSNLHIAGILVSPDSPDI